MAPMHKTFFNPQCIQSFATYQAQTKLLPRFIQNIKNMLGKIRRHKNLPTQFTGIRQALCFYSSMTNVKLLKAVERESVIRDVYITDYRQQIAAFRAHDAQHPKPRSHVSKFHVFLRQKMITQMEIIAPRVRDRTHHHEAVIGMTRKCHITFNSAAIIQHQGVNHPTRFDCHVVGTNPLKERLGVRAFDHQLA